MDVDETGRGGYGDGGCGELNAYGHLYSAYESTTFRRQMFLFFVYMSGSWGPFGGSGTPTGNSIQIVQPGFESL